MKSFKLFIAESTKPKKNEYSKGMIAYHGTARQFDSFDSKAARHDSTKAANEIEGHFFTNDHRHASSYASMAKKHAGVEGKARVITTRLNMDNPKDVTNEIAKHQKTGMSFGDAKRKAYAGVDRTKHDGVYHRGNSFNHAEYVPFHPSKIDIVK